jgi:hypothetical protein
MKKLTDCINAENTTFVFFIGYFSISFLLTFDTLFCSDDSSSDEDDDDDDDDDDNTAELLAELEKIKKERAEEKERQERQRQEEAEAAKEEQAMTGNPLLDLAEEKRDFSVKRR